MVETKKTSESKNDTDTKKVEKEVETKVETKTVSTPKTSSKSKSKSKDGVTTVILGLVIIQFIFIIFLAISVSTQGYNMDNMNKNIDDINEKVTKIDTFFSSNAPGYGGSEPGQVAPTTAPNAPIAQKVELSQLDIEGEPTIGDKNAPVTIVEYSDYECPFCGKFFSESYLQLKEEYIDTGKVKLVFKDFPLGFHDLAIPASAAANCVQSQLGDIKYFEMHDKIFSTQSGLNVANLAKWAIELGVEEDEFNTCVKDEKVLSEITEDLAQGSQLGVSGTPSFFINGNLIVGAQPYSVIKSMIETELNN